ncbi:hypothetical protein AMK23_08470 [Streptomyces sp. CB02130]|uniref:hypothetical protein n=1 Tax=Streptomyces sp. CB02130 TaxID=1703934 RepID=UPI00093C8982|nr:hypothetical protein [Streptomyces sp. CB02130]OKJ28429.1 hypothetical protein AMK23_08470 [Streptomyces sp. CB02130]
MDERMSSGARSRRPAPLPARVVLAARVLLAVAAFVVALLLTTACEAPGGTATDDRGPVPAPPAPSPYGVVFLGPGDCSSRGPVIREVFCRSEKAAATVLARHLGTPSSGPPCPDATDFVLHVSETGTGARSRLTTGYACMRNLEPPHPGDPGQGGGPLTVVGDCVTASRAGEVTETACADAGGRAPRYRVESAVRRRAQCPDDTDLFVSLRGEKPVGCARRSTGW